jgi:hypothetical protein
MDDQQQQTKREFLAKWVRAVNGHGGFGNWVADVPWYPKDVLEVLERHNKADSSKRLEKALINLDHPLKELT